MTFTVRKEPVVIIGFAVVIAIYYVFWGFPEIASLGIHSREFPAEVERDRAALSIAKAACKVAPENFFVLATRRVSRHLATLPDCPAPFFIDLEDRGLPVGEKLKRNNLAKYVSVKEYLPFRRSARFVAALRRYRIRTVVISREGMRNGRFKQMLRQTGYEKVKVVEGSHIWVQEEDWNRQDEEQRFIAEAVCRRVPRDGVVLAPPTITWQLAKLGCCRTFLGNLPDFLTEVGSEEKLEALENLLVIHKSPSPVNMTLIEKIFSMTSFAAVVVIHKSGKYDRLKDFFAGKGLELEKKRKNYRIWISKPESGE